jgi:hypothetical protein
LGEEKAAENAAENAARERGRIEEGVREDLSLAHVREDEQERERERDSERVRIARQGLALAVGCSKSDARLDEAVTSILSEENVQDIPDENLASAMYANARSLEELWPKGDVNPTTLAREWRKASRRTAENELRRLDTERRDEARERSTRAESPLIDDRCTRCAGPGPVRDNGRDLLCEKCRTEVEAC